MSNNKKFVVKNGLQAQNIDFVSPNEANTITVTMLDADTLSVSGDSGQLVTISDSATDKLQVNGSMLATTLKGNLDWSYIQSKPDPVITVTLTGDVTGTANTTLTDLASGTVSVTTTTRTTITESTTPPVSPQVGDRWISSTSGIEYTYINDGDSSQWIDLSSESAGTPVFIQSASPSYSGGPYLWIQTNVGTSGSGFALWVEDGQ